MRRSVPSREFLTRREAVIDEVAIAPQGDLVAYTRRITLRGANVRHLWVVPWAGGRPRQLTTGAFVDHAPAFAPDGRSIAFLSDRGGGTDQLWEIASEGGDATRVTSLPGGVTGFAWRRDARAFAVTAHDRAPGKPPVVRVIDRLDWRDDDTYGLMDNPTHVHLVTRRGRSTRLTAGDWFAFGPRFLPDGRVAFLADLRAERDTDPRPSVHAVSAAGEPSVEVLAAGGAILAFAVRDDGAVATIAHSSIRPPDDDPAQLALDGVLVPGQDDRFADRLSADGTVAWVAQRGRELVVRVEREGLVGLIDDQLLPTIDALAAAGDRVAAAATFGTGFAEIHALAQGRAPRRLTTHGASWFRRLPQPDLRELAVPGPDGPVLTWLLSPPGAGDAARATVLAFHGGPVWHWGPAPELGLQLLVQAGYRVALPNVRGSYGFGRRWIADLVGHWGEPDAADAHAVADHLVATGLADPARLGCFGRSYGGFLVNWLVGTSELFAAAVSEAGVVNQVAAFAGSDCGVTYNEAAGLGTTTTPEGVASLWRQSPLRHVSSVRTPLLILQGESDYRCAPSDAEQLFVALRSLGREVRYVLYPGGGHAYHRLARPDQREDRHARLVGWFERYMPA